LYKFYEHLLWALTVAAARTWNSLPPACHVRTLYVCFLTSPQGFPQLNSSLLNNGTVAGWLKVIQYSLCMTWMAKSDKHSFA